MSIRGLTLRQPWLYAIKEMGKDRENRSWKPYRVPTHIALHGGVYNGSKAYDREIAQAFDWMTENVPGATKQYLESRLYEWKDTVMTGIVAVMPWRGFDEPTAATSPWHVAGQFGWRLEDIIWLPKPIPCVGKQGLWTLSEDVYLKLVNLILNHKPSAVEIKQVVGSSELFGGKR